MKKQLDFSSVKLYGRSNELQVLQNAYKRVCAEEESSQVALVHGVAGSGKSTLVLELRKWMETQEKSNCYFCTGKFDKLRMTQPYSGISTAFSELCEISVSPENKSEVSASFMEAVGNKGKLLANVVPKIRHLFRYDSEEDDSNEATGNTTEALNQLKFVFRAFVWSLCTQCECPVVIFLDDLQWADAASIELIEAMLDDSKLKNLLFIGAFRDQEQIAQPDRVPEKLMGIAKEDLVAMIQLGNLESRVVNQLIADLTEMDTSSTQRLTDVVWDKTHGNPFFVIEFLKLLADEELLVYDWSKYKWTWDVAKIQSGTDLMDNVVELIARKIEKLPDHAKSTMKLAACVGSTFDAETLKTIISHGKKNGMNDCNEECQIILSDGKKAVSGKKAYDDLCLSILGAGDDLVEHLDLAAQEGLLDKIDGTTRYKFGHDRIQQAAYSLIPEGRERDLLHHWIGELILEMTLSPEKEEWMFFVAADQLNRGSAFIVDDVKRIELAKLNLLVGEKAIGLSAFVPASDYLRSGFELLHKEDRWKEHYDLTLKFCNVLADTELCIGNFDGMRIYVQEVIENARTLEEKTTAYYTLGFSLFTQAKQHEFFNLCFDLLSQLGQPLPTSAWKLQVKREYTKTNRMLSGLADEDLLGLPLMTDEKKITAMRLLTLACVSRSHLGMIDHASMVAMRMVQLSLQHGNCRQTPLAYALWGIVHVQRVTNLDEGYRYGKLALRLSEKLHQEDDPRVVVFVMNFLNHWKEPLTNILAPLLSGYKTAMVNGDTTWAFQNILAYQSNYFLSGLPLAPIVEDMLAYTQQMLEYKQMFVHRAIRPLLQCMLNLAGRSKDPLVLTGEVMDQNEFENPSTNPNRIGLQAIASCRMQLAYYFGDLELAAKLSRELRKQIDSSFVAHHLMCARTMFFGLISAALARKTKRRKHFVQLRKVIAHMEEGWVKRGAVNCFHKLLVLKAECASLKCRDGKAIKEAYDSAITTSRRTGFVQDEALANERAGVFFLENSNKLLASSYLTRAHDLYIEWGASAKAEQLRDHHGALLSGHEGTGQSLSLRGKQQFSNKVSKSHKSLNTGQLFR